ncbi:hypothetical protein Lal_00022869 [Lupinus albus]|nr:hypothetical protein Lal_00022869 [Lupinus albus]
MPSMFQEHQVSNIKFVGLGYSDICDPIIECHHCGSLIWYKERKHKYRNTSRP